MKRYRGAERDAVAGLDLTVRRGEIYALLGPNGSGKSTTVAVIVTLAAPTAGRVTVLGRDVLREPMAVRARLGVALQETGVDRLQTGRELLTLHARLLGRPVDRVEDLLEAVGLTEAADQRAGKYSGGMRRRLDLALALVGDPEVLVLDEPTTGLDPVSRETLWARVRDVRDAGTTVLLTTQYLEEADRLADRIGILDGGHLVAEGTPAELKTRYRAATLDDVYFAATGARRSEDRPADLQVVGA